MRLADGAKRHAAIREASAPASPVVSVRFRFVDILFPPAVSRGCSGCFSPARGSVPGPGSPGRLFDSPSIEFRSVKILFSSSLRSGAVMAPRRPIRPASSPSALPRPAFTGSVQVRQRVAPPSGFPVYHPVPTSSSARLLFVSFMGCISVRLVSFLVQFQFSSASFHPARSFLFVPFCSLVPVRSVLFSLVVRFVFLSLFHV